MSEHAKSNAANWAESIADMMARLKAAQEADDSEAWGAVLTEIDGSPLDIRVRDGWRGPHDDDKGEPEEYFILLSTGGPALRIYGALCWHEPEDAVLQWQDWGTPWTDFLELTEEQADAILAYARQFGIGG